MKKSALRPHITDLIENWFLDAATPLYQLDNPTANDQLAVCHQWMKKLYSQVCETPHFQQCLSDISQPKKRRFGWAWRTLLESSQMRMGILGVFPNAPIPLHNHPETSGFIYSLSGCVAIEQYDAPLSDQNPNTPNIELFKTNEQTLSPKQATFFGTIRGNIHTLSACDGPAIILDVLLNPYDENKRSWYVPSNHTLATKNGIFVTSHQGRTPIKTAPTAVLYNPQTLEACHDIPL